MKSPIRGLPSNIHYLKTPTSGTIPSGPPVYVVAPVISGLPNVGQTLSCSTGTWNGALPITYTYQWTRNGVNIAGATNATYLLVAADLGTNTFCKVTATNAVNNAVAASNTIGPIEPALEAPVNVTPPAVTGTATVGSTLSANGGTWTGYPAVVPAYQWKRDGSLIVGANTATYLLTASDETHMIKCTVTGTNSSGSASADSNSVGPITAAGVNPLLTVGALTLPNAGARVVGSGLTNGTYQTYWTISGGTTLTRNATVGTPTPGTYSMGGVSVTVEANVYDVGTGELPAVFALGATISGKTIKILPGADALTTSVVNPATVVLSGVTLASPVTITSRDIDNRGFLRSMDMRHVGSLIVDAITWRDGWIPGMPNYTAMVDVQGGGAGCSITVTRCEIYGPSSTEGQMNPPATSAVTTGYFYIVASVSSANWTSVGGPAAATVGDVFMASATNANIAALGTVYLQPQRRRAINGLSGITTTSNIAVSDCWIHDVEYALVGFATSWDVQRNKIQRMSGDGAQISPLGTETKILFKDNLIMDSANILGNNLGGHTDGMQLLLLDMATPNSNQYQFIGNRTWPAGSVNAEPYQGLFLSNPQTPAKAVNVLYRHNIISSGQAQGLAFWATSALAEMSYNTICYDTRYTVGPYSNIPKIVAGGEIGGAAIFNNVHSGFGFAPGDAPLTWAKTQDNYQFATFDNAGYAAVLNGTSFGSNDFPNLAAFTYAMLLNSTSPALSSYGPNPGAGSYYIFDNTPPPVGSVSGLGTGLSTLPAAIVPQAFTAGMWACTDLTGGAGLQVSIITKPKNGGAVYTTYQYKVGAGSWVSANTVDDFVIPGAALTMGSPNNIMIRALNSVGGGADSDTKTRTPTNNYVASAVRFPASAYIQTGGQSVTGTKKATVSFNALAPSSWSNSGGQYTFVSTPHSGLSFRALPAGGIIFSANNNADAVIIPDTSTPTLSTNLWYTFVLSLDTTAASKAFRSYYRVTGDTDWTLISSTAPVSSDQLVADVTAIILNDVGARAMDYADFYINYHDFIDLSVKANRDKFLPTANKGSNGATPTGSQPEYFFSGALASWNTNKGSAGGTFTVNGGPLVAAPSNPT